MQDLLTNVQTWALILGLITPLAQSVVQRPEWGTTVRVIVAVVAALLVGTVTVLANGEFDPANWFTTLGIVLATSQTAYALVWKPSGLAKVIELNTSRGGKHRRNVHEDRAA